MIHPSVYTPVRLPEDSGVTKLSQIWQGHPQGNGYRYCHGMASGGGGGLPPEQSEC